MKILSTILGIGLILVLVAFLIYNSIGLVRAIKKWRKNKKIKNAKKNDDDTDVVSKESEK